MLAGLCFFFWRIQGRTDFHVFPSFQRPSTFHFLWHLTLSSKPATVAGVLLCCHLSVVCCLPLSPLKTLVTTLVPPGYTRLISYLKFSNLNFICNPNSSLPCNVTYLQSLVIKTLNYNSLRIYLIFTLGHFVVMVCYLQYWLYNNLSSMNIKNFLRSCLTHSKLSKLLASIKIVISWYYLNFLTKQLNKSSFLY